MSNFKLSILAMGFVILSACSGGPQSTQAAPTDYKAQAPNPIIENPTIPTYSVTFDVALSPLSKETSPSRQVNLYVTALQVKGSKKQLLAKETVLAGQKSVQLPLELPGGRYLFQIELLSSEETPVKLWELETPLGCEDSYCPGPSGQIINAGPL